MKNNRLINNLPFIYPEISIDIHKVKGYSDDEIEKIKRFYDIKITEQLYSFLSCIGRCSGGVFDDSSLLFYYNNFSVRNHIQFQIDMCERLCNIQQHDLLDQKPFFFSIESENEYLFLLTNSEENNKVYCYDENERVIKDIHWEFNDYLKHLIGKSKKGNINSILKDDFIGELIEI
ncbi:SMI1/KNR4 family protein [Proteus mirabilis]|nr:SMI1/KNR4 family protein [Proteus mirabilis]